MKRSWTISVGLLGTLLVAAGPASAGWVQDGTSLNVNVNSQSYYPAITVANGTPFVAWQEDEALYYQIRAKAWNGVGWTQLGTSLNVNTMTSGLFPVAASFNNTPYVSWYEGDIYRTYVKYWNGAQWVSRGSLNINAMRNAKWPSLAFTASGTLYAAYVEDDGTNYQVFVKHWNGSGWQLDGGSLNVNPVNASSYPSLAISQGTIYVAWLEANQIFVKHWAGSTWTQDGTGSLNLNLNRTAFWPTLGIVNNTPYVAWQEANPSNVFQIYMKHWNGSAWVRDGDCANVDPVQNARYPRMTVLGQTPYLSWYENRISNDQVYISYWNGSAWNRVGDSLNVNSQRNGQYPTLAFRGMTPYAAWYENNGTANQVVVKHFAPSTPTPGPTTATPVPPGAFLKLINNQIDPDLGGQVTVRWTQPRTSKTTITVYSLAGEKIITLVDGAAYASGQYHEVHWDGRNPAGTAVGSGIYIVHIKAEGFEERGKVAVVK